MEEEKKKEEREKKETYKLYHRIYPLQKDAYEKSKGQGKEEENSFDEKKEKKEKKEKAQEGESLHDEESSEGGSV